MVNKGEGPSLHNLMQLWLGIKILGKKEGRLVYVEKDSLSILEYTLHVDTERVVEATMKELEILNKAWKAKLPPRPPTDSKDWKIKYCRWHKKCVSLPEYLQE